MRSAVRHLAEPCSGSTTVEQPSPCCSGDFAIPTTTPTTTKARSSRSTQTWSGTSTYLGIAKCDPFTPSHRLTLGGVPDPGSSRSTTSIPSRRSMTSGVARPWAWISTTATPIPLNTSTRSCRATGREAGWCCPSSSELVPPTNWPSPPPTSFTASRSMLPTSRSVPTDWSISRWVDVRRAEASIASSTRGTAPTRNAVPAKASCPSSGSRSRFRHSATRTSGQPRVPWVTLGGQISRH